MIGPKLSIDADAASRRYLALLTGFRGIFARTVGSQAPAAQKARDELREVAYELARSYLATERELIDGATREVAQGARVDALRALGASQRRDLGKTLTAHLSATADYLERELAIQVERDVAGLVRMLQAMALEVSLEARGDRSAMAQALARVRAETAIELRFTFADRAARRWPSHKFARSAWRDHLLATYNETFLLTLAEHGVEEAVVLHPDPRHQFRGARVTLAGDGDAQRYSEIRAEIFHPNSDAQIGFAEPEA